MPKRAPIPSPVPDRDAIRRRMAECSITQHRLADEAGIAQPNLCRWLASEPTLGERNAKAIVDALNRLTGGNR